MWFEERSWSNLKVNELVEEWRDLWSFKVDFLVAGLAYVFATTNLLNLPKLILENGGLAFVCAYGAVLLFCVLPILIMELSIGQLTGRAPVLAFYNICPIFKGVGVSQILMTILVLASMSRFLSWLLLYTYYLIWTVHEDRPDLPWLRCRGFPEMMPSFGCRDAGSAGNFTSNTHLKLITLNQESSLVHFMNAVDPPAPSINEFDSFNLPMLIATGAIWLGVLFGIAFGVRWLGKVIPFTFMAAFSMCLALLIRALTMDAFMDVVNTVWAVTDWQVLLDYRVWKIVTEQALLATGLGFGTFITMGSYCKRNNNLVGDSLFIIFGHCILSVMQVLTVFGIVGYLSHKLGMPIIDLLDKGETQQWHILAYFTHIPHVKLWSGLYLVAAIFILLSIFMLLSLSVLSSLEDSLGERWSRCLPRFFLALFVCGLLMTCSLYFTTKAGRHAYELVTSYLKYGTLWVILFAELLAVSWFYCAHRLGSDLHSVLRRFCCSCLGHFLLLFTYLLPVVPLGICVLNLLSYSKSSLSPPVLSWEWSEWVGMGIALFPLIPIPLYALFALCNACCCGSSHESRTARCKEVVRSRVRRTESSRTASVPPRYSSAAPGYLLLPQAPLAQPEPFYEARS